MKTLRTCWLQKTLLWLLIVVVADRSIDAPDVLRNLDRNPLALEENRSFNETESVLERWLEKGLEMSDAFPEGREADSDRFLKETDFFSPIPFVSCLSPQVPKAPSTLHFSFQHALFQDPSLDVNSPPPKPLG